MGIAIFLSLLALFLDVGRDNWISNSSLDSVKERTYY
jgi:hypothetical protein